MMTKKIYFLLAFLLTTIGGGKLWAGAHTVVFNYDEDGLLRTQFTRPLGGNSTTIVSSPITLTFISTSERSVNSNITDGEMKFEGAQKNANNGSSLQVSCSSNALIKSISFTSKATGNVNNFTASAGTYTAESSSTIGTWTGSTTSVTFTTENGNVDKITSISVTYSDVVVEYSNSYPYTWDFTNWETTASTLESDANWSNSAPYAYQTSLLTAAALQLSSGELKETKGLKFENDASTRIAASPDNYLQMYSTVIVVPSLKKGHVVTFTTNIVSGNSQYAHISVSDVNITRTTSGDKYVFTYNAVTDGDVRFNVQALAGNPLQILSIAVEKGEFTMSLNSTDLNRYAETRGNGDSKNNTSDPGSMANIESIVYDAAHPYIRMKLNLNKLVQSEIGVAKADYATYFKATNSSDATVLDVSNSYASQVGADDVQSTTGKGDRVYIYDVKMLKPGESNLTFKFVGGDNFGYAEKEITTKVVITKSPQTLEFAEAAKYVNYGQDAPTNTLTQTPSVGGGAVSYSSSDTHVATVNEDGILNIHHSGTCTITATAAETGNYLSATANYTLTVNGSTTPTLTWINNSNFPSLSGTTLAYGNIAYCFATATGTTAPVQYKSSNTKIATVAVEAHGSQTNACKITPTGNGEVTITAYVEGSGDVNPAETSFIMTIEGQEVHMSFQPTSGKVRVGKTITPYISVPDIKMADITSVTVTTSDALKATVTAGETTETSATYTLTKANGGLTSYTKDDTEYLEHIYATIKGEAVTSSSVAITVTVNSDIYKPTTATYQVTVNNNDLNFNWEAPSQTYTLYTGDYMMIPAITGNANGNWSYSKGSTCESEHAYLYDIKSGTPTWNNRPFKIGEGIPDYSLYESDGTTVTDKAYIVWVNGQSVHTDVLMIYAKTPGTVKLHAKDPQTGASPEDITINIINKSTLTSAKDTYVGSMSFPYTWSFVGESSIATVSPNYWEDKGDYYTCGMSTAFNFDYCDEDNDGNTGEALKGKYFVDANGIMPQFYGMTVEFGNSGGSTHSYKAKEDKLRLYKYNSNNPDQPLLQVVGGTHKIALPAPGAGCPSNYKLFVKARSRKDPANDAILQAYWNDSNNPYYSFTNNDPIIFSVDVTSGDPVKELWVSDVDIYWIAMSTEVKDVARPAANSTLTYAAASYSYPKALDLSKSAEVNSGVTAYYASDYAFDKDAAATNTEGYAVVLTAITSPVPANTGLVLRKNTTDVSTSCYMIANGENELGYEPPAELSTNYLKATSPSGKTVGSTATISSTTYTNFAMAYAYKMYHDPTNPGSVYTDYLFDRDWSFYKIMGNVSISNQKSYLQIPGNLYVDREGNIVQGASRRAADDNRPSTKPMLDIIFEDEPSGDHNVTGITSVSDRIIDNDAWYTLQGIRVDAPAKGGIYIHNGRKVVIK